MVIWSINSRCRSVTRTPESDHNSSTEPTQTTSCQSCECQMGNGVPQYRSREIAQSPAPTLSVCLPPPSVLPVLTSEVSSRIKRVFGILRRYKVWCEEAAWCGATPC